MTRSVTLPRLERSAVTTARAARHVAVALCVGLVLALPGTSAAQQQAEPPEAQQAPVAPPASEFEAGKVELEAVDSTRLDVARLPTEAIALTRDLYARGLFVEAQLGALGFVGDLGDVSEPGPRLGVAGGYEITRWLSVLVTLDASFHNTDNRTPPAHTMYEMLGASAGLRLTLPLTLRTALWVGGLAGIVYAGGDVLHALGFAKSTGISLQYGAELGFDWHVLSRHHSLGVSAGGRMYPDLVRDASSFGVYGTPYLRYVF